MPEPAGYRVGIVLDSRVQPAWIIRTLESIRESSLAEIALVLLTKRAEGKRSAAFLTRIYTKLDALLFRRAATAQIARDASSIIEKSPVLEVDVPITESDAQRIRDHRLDVLISFVGRLDGRDLAHYGVWWFRHGATAHPLPGFSEFSTQHAVTEAAIETTRGANSLVLESTRVATDRISFTRGADQLFWQSVPLAVRALGRLKTNAAYVTPRPPDVPRRGEMRSPLLLIPRIAARLAAQKMRDRLTRLQWFVAYSFESYTPGNNDFRRYHRLIPRRDRLWADPFVISSGDSAYIFVEEMLFSDHRGAIAVIEAQRDGTWSQPRRVLERPFHLSYPCVFSWQGTYYMVPESAENGTVDLYRSVEFPWRWEEETTLFRDVEAADTTVFEHDGRWWAFLAAKTYHRAFEELWIYYADQPRGPWRPHKRNPVISDAIGGRPGGRPFRSGGSLYRAAQNGSRGYGYGLDVREMTKLTPDEWQERTVAEILPQWHRGLIGTHTLNTDGTVTVIDGLLRRWGIKRRR